MSEDEFGVRDAVRAGDRSTAAEKLRPGFEKRLTELGYQPRAIAHAFSLLEGPGTVAQAPDVLRAPVPGSHPVALGFHVTETRGGPSAANNVEITSVDRDGAMIHVNYEIVPSLAPTSLRTQAEARDDLGRDHRGRSSHSGLTGSTGLANTRARGRLTMPLPPPPAAMLRIRIRWDAPPGTRMPWEAPGPSIWERPAHEVRVCLAG